MLLYVEELAHTHRGRVEFVRVSAPRAKSLRFVHITKTGGSSIESIGSALNLSWGKLDSEFRDATVASVRRSDAPEPWHHTLAAKRKHLRTKYAWFMFVRNPYHRLVSEFHCVYGGMGYAARNATVAEFNAYVRRRIHKRPSAGGHYTEQCSYLLPSASVVMHVGKYESLEEDFERIAFMYDLRGARLNRRANPNNRGSYFSPRDFDPASVALIQQTYACDFEVFGYSTRPPGMTAADAAKRIRAKHRQVRVGKR